MSFKLVYNSFLVFFISANICIGLVFPLLAVSLEDGSSSKAVSASDSSSTASTLSTSSVDRFLLSNIRTLPAFPPGIEVPEITLPPSVDGIEVTPNPHPSSFSIKSTKSYWIRLPPGIANVSLVPSNTKCTGPVVPPMLSTSLLHNPAFSILPPSPATPLPSSSSTSSSALSSTTSTALLPNASPTSSSTSLSSSSSASFATSPSGDASCLFLYYLPTLISLSQNADLDPASPITLCSIYPALNSSSASQTKWGALASKKVRLEHIKSLNYKEQAELLLSSLSQAIIVQLESIAAAITSTDCQEKLNFEDEFMLLYAHDLVRNCQYIPRSARSSEITIELVEKLGLKVAANTFKWEPNFCLSNLIQAGVRLLSSKGNRHRRQKAGDETHDVSNDDFETNFLSSLMNNVHVNLEKSLTNLKYSEELIGMIIKRKRNRQQFMYESWLLRLHAYGDVLLPIERLEKIGTVEVIFLLGLLFLIKEKLSSSSIVLSKSYAAEFFGVKESEINTISNLLTPDDIIALALFVYKIFNSEMTCKMLVFLSRRQEHFLSIGRKLESETRGANRYGFKKQRTDKQQEQTHRLIPKKAETSTPPKRTYDAISTAKRSASPVVTKKANRSTNVASAVSSEIEVVTICSDSDADDDDKQQKQADIKRQGPMEGKEKYLLALTDSDKLDYHRMSNVRKMKFAANTLSVFKERSSGTMEEKEIKQKQIKSGRETPEPIEHLGNPRSIDLMVDTKDTIKFEEAPLKCVRAEQNEKPERKCEPVLSPEIYLSEEARRNRNLILGRYGGEGLVGVEVESLTATGEEGNSSMSFHEETREPTVLSPDTEHEGTAPQETKDTILHTVQHKQQRQTSLRKVLTMPHGSPYMFNLATGLTAGGSTSAVATGNVNKADASTEASARLAVSTTEDNVAHEASTSATYIMPEHLSEELDDILELLGEKNKLYS